MQPTKRHFLFISLLVLSSFSLGAQTTENQKQKTRIKLASDFQLGMVTGGQITNEQFVYKSGFIGQFSVNARLSPWLYAGLGFGIESLDTETIIPSFIDFKARLNQNERSSFLGVNVGSSSGRSTYYRNFSDYDYHGGFYFSPYYAFQFPVKENLSFLISTGYIHQVGWIEYFTEYNETYLESFTMDFLTIRAGLRFK